MTTSIEKLSEVSTRLKEERDRLNKTVLELGARIAEAGVAVTVWLDERLVAIADGRWQLPYEIGYTEVDKEWRVAVRRMRRKAGPVNLDAPATCWHEDPRFRAISLVDAPVEVRFEAVPHLDKLVEAIVERTGQLLGRVGHTPRRFGSPDSALQPSSQKL